MKKIKRLLVLAMSLCMTVSALTLSVNAEEKSPVTSEDIQEFIANPDNADRVKSGVCFVDTRGASDEYYSCGTPEYTDGEFVLATKNAGSEFLQAGATVTSILAPVNWFLSGLAASWMVVGIFTIPYSNYFKKTEVLYGRLGNMTCTVYDAMGNYKYTAQYSGITFQVRKEIRYS